MEAMIGKREPTGFDIVGWLNDPAHDSENELVLASVAELPFWIQNIPAEEAQKDLMQHAGLVVAAEMLEFCELLATKSLPEAQMLLDLRQETALIDLEARLPAAPGTIGNTDVWLEEQKCDALIVVECAKVKSLLHDPTFGSSIIDRLTPYIDPIKVNLMAMEAQLNAHDDIAYISSNYWNEPWRADATPALPSRSNSIEVEGYMVSLPNEPMQRIYDALPRKKRWGMRFVQVVNVMPNEEFNHFVKDRALDHLAERVTLRHLQELTQGDGENE